MRKILAFSCALLFLLTSTDVQTAEKKLALKSSMGQRLDSMGMIPISWVLHYQGI